jgi:hypothetical protein
MVSNITLTDNDGNVVTIGATQCDEVWTNEIQLIKIPKSLATDSEGKTTKLVNLNRNVRTFDVDGFIKKGGEAVAGDFSGSDTVEQQRTKLRNMTNSVRNITLDYGSGVSGVGGSIQKMSIKEIAGTSGYFTDPDARTGWTIPAIYTVKVVLIEGTNVLGA